MIAPHRESPTILVSQINIVLERRGGLQIKEKFSTVHIWQVLYLHISFDLPLKVKNNCDRQLTNYTLINSFRIFSIQFKLFNRTIEIIHSSASRLKLFSVNNNGDQFVAMIKNRLNQN